MSVFLSYNQADRAWAAKLAAEIQRLGLQVFFDQNALRAGEGWESATLAALQGAEYLVVVWSKDAKASNWVQRELGHFDGLRYQGGQRIGGRVLVHVLLDDTGTAYGSDESINDIKDSSGYANGPDALPVAVWTSVFNKLSLALKDSSTPVTRAIIALERRFVAGDDPDPVVQNKRVNFSYQPPGGRTLDALLADLAISKADLLNYYGDRRGDWKPSGGTLSIERMLEDVRNHVNGLPKATPIRWVPVDDDLFSDEIGRIKLAAGALSTGLAVGVVDPVALYSAWIRNVLQYLEPCLNNPHAIMLVLPVFPTPGGPRTTHRQMVEQVYDRLVRQFYEELPLLELAQCSIFTADDGDIRRLVRGTLREYSTPLRQGATSAFLGMSGRR